MGLTEHKPTGVVADLPFSAGDTVKTADRLPLPPGYTLPWWAALTAHRPDRLRGKTRPLREGPGLDTPGLFLFGGWQGYHLNLL